MGLYFTNSLMKVLASQRCTSVAFWHLASVNDLLNDFIFGE